MHKLIFQCVWKGTQTRRSQHLVGSVARCSFGGDPSALYDITKGQFPKKMSVLSHTSKGWMDFVSWDRRQTLTRSSYKTSESFICNFSTEDKGYQNLFSLSRYI